jgi:hypothetical protein
LLREQRAERTRNRYVYGFFAMIDCFAATGGRDASAC